MHVLYNYLYFIGFFINLLNFLMRKSVICYCDGIQNFCPSTVYIVLCEQKLKYAKMLNSDMLSSMWYDDVLWQWLSHYTRYDFILYIYVWKDRGCYKKVKEHMQISSTESTSFHGIQTSPVNHLLNDKSDKSK